MQCDLKRRAGFGAQNPYYKFLYFCSISCIAILVSCNSGTKRAATCQKPGKAIATALDGERIHFDGPSAIGGAGDFLLQNGQAAYVIQGVDRGISYYHYGGILVDAVAMQGCEQASADELEEVGLLLGQLELDDPLAKSTLRAFRATSIEVINDGKNGEPAHIRATGVDDYYWLIEYTLIAAAGDGGGEKLLSQPYGIEIQVDYILSPNSPVLQIDYNLVNKEEQEQEFMAASIMILGNNIEQHRFAKGNIEFSGFEFATGIPWIGAHEDFSNGGYAFTVSDAEVGSAVIAGVNAVFDLNQALTKPLRLRSAGDVATTTFLFSTGPKDANSAAKHLAGFPTALPDEFQIELIPLNGKVFDGNSAAPVSGAFIELQVETDIGWETIDSYKSATDGTFGNTRISFVNESFDYRLLATIPGRGVVIEPDISGDIFIQAPLAGRLKYDIQDTSGNPLPAEISLYQDDERIYQFFVHGQGAEPVVPGEYELVVSRGFEYARHVDIINVPAAGNYEFTTKLERILDTSGYLSIDTHIHAGPSADSKVPINTRVANAGAVGLEVAVATDHEAIVGLQSGIDALGLHDWVSTITGEEVTAVLPEHLTMFPATPDGTLRGGIVEWYQLGLPELWDAIHERSNGGVALLNHPSQIYNLLEWDPVAGAPAIEDYSELQMTKSDKPWSWDFEGVELMNGPKQIFRSADAKIGDRHFDAWMSFHNHGHRIAGVGCSDAHGLENLGMSRTFYRSPTDNPIEATDQHAVDAFKNLNLLVSAGAFARIESVNGQAIELGELAADADGVVDVKLSVQALPEIDVTHIRVYANCDQVREFPTTASDETLKFSDMITAPVAVSGPVKDAHLVIAGFGKNRMPHGLKDYDPTNVPRFITNPIYIDTNGNGKFDPPGGKTCSYTLD